MEEMEVKDLLVSHAKELTQEDLEKLVKASEDDDDDETKEVKKQNFNLKTLAEIFRYGKLFSQNV